MIPDPNINTSHCYNASSANPDSQVKSKSNRRRSLFHIPLGARSKSFGYDDIDGTSKNPNTSTTLAGSVLPQDIIREIVDRLSPADMLSFSLTSSHLRVLLLPALYDTIILKSSDHCRRTLPMLLSNPHLCSYIKKLAVRPNYYLAWPKSDDTLDENWVVKQIISLSQHLTNMHTFDWDGLESPHDQLWEELRNNCPQLKGIFTNVGTRSLDPESALFSFTNLTSFSLIVRHGLGGTELFPALEEIPSRFWDMIFNHCPDLQELAICSFSSSSRVFNFERVTQGRWPKLHTLTLGSFGYQNDFSLGPPGLMEAEDDDDTDSPTNDRDDDSKISLGQFLDLHTELKYIRFLWNFKRWMSPISIPLSLSSTTNTTTSSLQNLDTFIGIYQQLTHVPHPEKIETLDLTCEPVYESRLPTVIPILRKLTHLTSLDIWMHVVDLGSGRGSDDRMGFFKTVLEACPELVDFHFMCTTSFTVGPLTQLLSYLHLLPRLKRFSLTKGHKYADENMLSTVLRIFKSCPKLVQVNLRWAREKCLNHLKQEGVYDVVEWEEEDCSGKGKRRKTMTEGLGRLPKTLMVSERGIPLFGRPFSRRYKYTFPGGTVDKRGLSLGNGKWNRWKLGRKRRVVRGVGNEGDTNVGTSTVVVENEGVESEAELDTNTEVEAEREDRDEEEGEEGEEETEEENIRVSASVKGKGVKQIGLPTPTTN